MLFFLIMGWAPEVGRDANEVRETTVSIVVFFSFFFRRWHRLQRLKRRAGKGVVGGGWWVVDSDAGGTLSTSARACDARI